MRHKGENTGFFNQTEIFSERSRAGQIMDFVYRYRYIASARRPQWPTGVIKNGPSGRGALNPRNDAFYRRSEFIQIDMVYIFTHRYCF